MMGARPPGLRPPLVAAVVSPTRKCGLKNEQIHHSSMAGTDLNWSHGRALNEEGIQLPKNRSCCYCTHLPVEQQVPGFAAERVADGDLDQIEGGVEHQAVQPYHARPSPPDRADRREADRCVHGDQCSHLQIKKLIIRYWEKFRNLLLAAEVFFFIVSEFRKSSADLPIVLGWKHKSAGLQVSRGRTSPDCVWRISGPGWWCWLAGTSLTRSRRNFASEISPWSETAIHTRKSFGCWFTNKMFSCSGSDSCRGCKILPQRRLFLWLSSRTARLPMQGRFLWQLQLRISHSVSSYLGLVMASRDPLILSW